MAHQFYSQLDTLIGQLKRSAIDAYMTWTLARGGHFSLEGDSSSYVMHDYEGVNYYVTRPNSNGEGGGTLSSEKYIFRTMWEYKEDPADLFSDPDQFARAFDEVRATIDSILEPWTDLPSLDGFDVQLDYCRELMSMLASSGSSNDGDLVPGGLITDDIAAVQGKINSMSGGAIGAFKQKFVDKLGSTVSNLHAVATILGAAMASEREVISQTRTTVADNVAFARDMFDKVAVGQGLDEDTVVILKIAAAAAKAAAVFLTGGLAAAAELTDIGLETAAEVSQVNHKVQARTYDEAMSAFEGLFTATNSNVLDGEQAIATSLTKNLNQMHSDSSYYDLTLPAISSTDGIKMDTKEDENLEVNIGLIDEIINTNMPTMADNLQDAAAKAFSIIMSSVAIRDPNIGLGLAGPNHEFDDLSYTLRGLLSDLSAEVRLGRLNLERTVNLLLETDGATSDSLNQVANDVENRTFDPWDTSRSKLFPPRPGQNEAL